MLFSWMINRRQSTTPPRHTILIKEIAEKDIEKWFCFYPLDGSFLFKNRLNRVLSVLIIICLAPQNCVPTTQNGL